MALAPVECAQGTPYFIAIAGQSPLAMQAVVAALLASALAFGLMWRWFARRLQGFTGDCLGATQQVCELAFYLSLGLAL